MNNTDREAEVDFVDAHQMRGLSLEEGIPNNFWSTCSGIFSVNMFLIVLFVL